MLHVLNGDATREKLERAGLPGRMTVWADVLHEGPVPDVPEAELRRVRAAHLAGGYHEPESDVLRELEGWDAALEGWDAALEGYSHHDEVIFWYEHDLFDQLILLRHLHWLSSRDPGVTRFSAVPADDYLGPSSPEQLAALFPQREEVTAEQIAAGARAWQLFRAPDPERLVEWTMSGAAHRLPFLGDALRRYFEEFPSVTNGLSRTERHVLEAVAGGPRRFAAAFRASQDREERVFMGDATLWLIARRLANAPQPVLTVSTDTPELDPAAQLTLTAAGRDVLANRADHVALNGLDRWLGGVHLTTTRHWRWDGARLLRVSTPNA